MAAVFLAIAAAIVVVELASIRDSEIRQGAVNAVEQRRAATNRLIAGQCQPPGLSDAEDCAAALQSALRSEEREIHDLAAQQVMALWTAIMGGMAVVGVALSGLGVYLVWTTFKATQRASESSMKTYEAYIAVERPRLHVSVEMMFEEEEGIYCQMAAQNYGRIDCIVYVFGTDWREKTADVTGDGIVLAQPKSILIKPGGKETLGMTHAGDVANKFLYVIVKYKSALSNDHRTYAAFEIWEEPRDSLTGSGRLPSVYKHREVNIKGTPADT